jgi:hypothetical protein
MALAVHISGNRFPCDTKGPSQLSQRNITVRAQFSEPVRKVLLVVIPVSPLRPKATPSAYFGSSSSETTFSPNSRGGSGRTEASQVLFRLHAHGVRVGVGARVADPGSANDLQRHDRLEVDAEAFLRGDTVGVFSHNPEHALGARIAARHRRAVHGRAARPHQDAASRLERQSRVCFMRQLRESVTLILSELATPGSVSLTPGTKWSFTMLRIRTI